MPTPNENQLAGLDKLAELEISVSRLYEAYAALFPDYRQFWSELVDEEKQHASWVQGLRALVEKGAAKFNENRFNTPAVQNYINYLKDEIGKAPERTLINALSIAKYNEESLIEREYFNIVEGDSDEMKQTLTKLAGATKSHIERVRKAINTYTKTEI
jgi:rubrerythrin